MRILLLVLILLTVSCGKKTDKGHGLERAEDRIISDMQAFLDKQEVQCDPGGCPSYLTKIIVNDGGGKVHFCTGFLVKSDVVATSSSCLPSFLRLNGLDCSIDVHFFFARTATGEALQVGCTKVIQASPIDGNDPVFWRDDLSFLQIETPLSRRVLNIRDVERTGMPNSQKYSLWAIEQVNDYLGIIRRHECKTIHQNYFNPLANDMNSPNMIVSGCPFKKGYAGAPILEDKELKAVVSQGVDPEIRAKLESIPGLLLNGLEDMLHVTNFACAPTIFDSTVADPRECAKALNRTEVNEARATMLDIEAFYEKRAQNLEETLNAAGFSPYFNFKVTLKPVNDVRVIVIEPKCFKKVSDFIRTLDSQKDFFITSYRFPQNHYKRIMNQYGVIQIWDIAKPALDFKFQMSTKTLRKHGTSNVFMWTGTHPAKLFKNLSESCQ